jgi:hypothetical protein
MVEKKNVHFVNLIRSESMALKKEKVNLVNGRKYRGMNVCSVKRHLAKL